MSKKYFFGTAAGTATTVLFLLFYWIDRPLILHPGLWWGSLVIYLILMYRAVKSNPAGDFKVALKPAFLTFVIANAIFYLFYYVMFGVFDTGLVDLQRQMLENYPMFSEVAKNSDLQVTPGNTFFRYCYSLIGGFVLALGVAAAARP